MPDSLYGARLQGFTVVVFIVAKSCAWFDEYIYHDSLQVHAIEGIGHCHLLLMHSDGLLTNKIYFDIKYEIIIFVFKCYLKGHCHEHNFQNSTAPKHVYTIGNLLTVVRFS